MQISAYYSGRKETMTEVYGYFTACAMSSVSVSVLTNGNSPVYHWKAWHPRAVTRRQLLFPPPQLTRSPDTVEMWVNHNGWKSLGQLARHIVARNCPLTPEGLGGFPLGSPVRLRIPMQEEPRLALPKRSSLFLRLSKDMVF